MNKKKEQHEQNTPVDETVAKEDLSRIEDLQKQLETAQENLAQTNDKMLRLMADSENTRRRASLDVENAHKYGIEKLARELLNVVDSLEHGLNAFSEPDNTQIVHLREGVQLTYKLLLDTLDKFKIKQIDPQGETFDPKQHEALTVQPTDELEPNKVLTVVQKGFTIHDRILRPARVVVTKAP